MPAHVTAENHSHFNQSAFAAATGMNHLVKTSYGGYPHVNLSIQAFVHLLS